MLANFLLIGAIFCALGATFVWPSPPQGRPHVGWLAIALFLGYMLIVGWHK